MLATGAWSAPHRPLALAGLSPGDAATGTRSDSHLDSGRAAQIFGSGSADR